LIILKCIMSQQSHNIYHHYIRVSILRNRAVFFMVMKNKFPIYNESIFKYGRLRLKILILNLENSL